MVEYRRDFARTNEYSYTVAHSERIRMINFKPFAIDERNGEWTERRPVFEFTNGRVESLLVHGGHVPKNSGFTNVS